MNRPHYEVDQITRTWAMKTVPDIYNYSSPAHWYRHALDKLVITKSELEQAREVYGDMFDYTGD